VTTWFQLEENVSKSKIKVKGKTVLYSTYCKYASGPLSAKACNRHRKTVKFWSELTHKNKYLNINISSSKKLHSVGGHGSTDNPPNF
jgi:hypothetical protein